VNKRLNKHKIRVLHEHTGRLNGEECTRWDGLVGLFLNTYNLGHGLHHENLAADGTRRGNYARWVHIGCNTAGCKFDALVNVQWLEEVVSEELETI